MCFGDVFFICGVFWCLAKLLGFFLASRFPILRDKVNAEIQQVTYTDGFKNVRAIGLAVHHMDKR